MESNPLKQYFRQPAIYIRLPSNGRYYPQGALKIAPDGEYPVLPMTTIDEITYRTPDALFNGSAVVTVIQSCVPNILDPWGMPAMDIDTVLVAIRIASYGHEMDVTTRCEKCTTESMYGVDLRTVLDKLRAPDYEKHETIGDLKIHFRPMNYRDINENSLRQFEEQKMLQNVEDSKAPDNEKLKMLSETLKKITAMTTQALAKSIDLIETPTARVNDANHITEWLANCDRKMFNRIRDHIIETKQQGELQPLMIKCGNCGHEYQQYYTLDMANFFEAAS